jgi:hypothetical protein
VAGDTDLRGQAAIPMAATACNAALVTYGAMTLPLTWGWGAMTALAAYAIAYGAINLFFVFRGARMARDAAGARRLQTAASLVNASLPVVFAVQAFASGGVSLLEWGGTVLMFVPACANWLAIRDVATKP